MKILCLGDSNTWGYDPRSFYGSRYPTDVRWTDQLGDSTVINCGMNGLSIPQNALVYRDLIKSKSPDLTIVMLGSNDLLEGASAAVTTERMNSFLMEIKAVTPAILLISPPSMRRGEWVQSEKLISESKKLEQCTGNWRKVLKYCLLMQMSGRLIFLLMESTLLRKDMLHLQKD